MKSPEPTQLRSAPEVLRKFLDFSNQADWLALEKIISNPNVSRAEFFQSIPEQVSDFAIFLRTPILYEALYAQAPKDARIALRKAKETADAHLSGIEHHPLITDRIRERVEETAGSEEMQQYPSGVLTELTRFSALPMWAEGEDGLAPVTALTLLGAEGKELLRITVDWDDASFLAFVFTQLLHQEFQRIDKMSERQKIDFKFAEQVLERAAKMKGAIEDIHLLATKMGLSKGKQSPNPS